MVVEKIRGIIRKEKLNHEKDIFNSADQLVGKHISNEIRPYVLMYNMLLI